MTKEDFEMYCMEVSDEAYKGIEALRKEVYGIDDEEFYTSYESGMVGNSIVLELRKRIDVLKQAEANTQGKLNELSKKTEVTARALLREAHQKENDTLKLIAIDLVGIETVVRMDLEKNYRLSKGETNYILSKL